MNRSLPTRSLHGLLLACALGCATLVQPVLGQQLPDPENPDTRWYQVEVIIFTQGSSPRETKEIWPTDIDLDYPANWTELADPAEVAAEELSPQAPTVQDSDDAVDSRMLLLSNDELSLRDQARRLARSRQHRVLFHEAWHQPLVKNRTEPSILIAGGETFDEHSELEGSINLYLGTYLHISTDLWLSQFATNFGQERRPWPALPWPPNRPTRAGSVPGIESGGTGLWQQLNQDRNDEYTAILAKSYVVENIALMQQERRMRSEELHYIDHPLMGVLVKLTPYALPHDRPEDSDEDASR